jgi:hypothetical protein
MMQTSCATEAMSGNINSQLLHRRYRFGNLCLRQIFCVLHAYLHPAAERLSTSHFSRSSCAGINDRFRIILYWTILRPGISSATGIINRPNRPRARILIQIDIDRIRENSVLLETKNSRLFSVRARPQPENERSNRTAQPNIGEIRMSRYRLTTQFHARKKT